MSNASIHNNDLLIPDGVTFFDSIYASGFAQMNGDSSRESYVRNLSLDEFIRYQATRINSTDT
jgi:hypothetical protein